MAGAFRIPLPESRWPGRWRQHLVDRGSSST
jgi:hypothetical protein